MSFHNVKLEWADHWGTPWRDGRESQKNSIPSALFLLQSKERTGNPWGGHRADKCRGVLAPLQEETQSDEKRKCSAMHRVGWSGRDTGTFTFTLSSGAHGKALLALAVVGAGCVDASLSSADGRLLTFISV